MRRAFTLIELLVSIAILSILMLFLYKSYAELNRVNAVYTKEVESLQQFERIKKTLYLDLSFAKKRTIVIDNGDKDFDLLFFQVNHSLHQRINPYISYIVHDKVLYRLESLQKISKYPIDGDIAFVIDKLGSVEKFKIFPMRGDNTQYLFDVKFTNRVRIILKVKVLN
jgi:prepilin-type N-terminal cleavage/methylation domain-containing protein